VAAHNGKMLLFQKPWELTKIVLTLEELKNKIFLTEDKFGRTIWYRTVENGHVDTLHNLWERGK